MKLKTVVIEGKTYAEVQDDKPVIVDDDGKDVAFDLAHTRTTISRLNGESKTQREAREAAEAKLKAYEGIDDADSARRALETVKNLKEGELLTAGQVQEIKDAARRAADEQVSAAAKEHAKKLKLAETDRDRFKGDLDSTLLGLAFTQSKFITERSAVPAAMMKAQFGSNFKFEDGKMIAHYPNGEKIFSVARPGDPANFDEAIETLVEQYPYRDSILKGTGSTGGGSRGSVASGGGSGRTMTMSAFNALHPAQQAQIMSGKDRPTLVE